jgi:hypothetical protein
MTRTLYHFTKPEFWAQIRTAGVLIPRWPEGGSAPKTVHMTDSDNPDDLPWRFAEGRTVRMELRIPEAQAQRWVEWGELHVPPQFHQSLGIPVKTPEHPEGYISAWNQGSERWFVVTREVPAAEWGPVVDIETGQELWGAASA